MKMAALYESVTNNIIRDLQQGAIPWTKPWKTKTVGTIMPGNIVTGRSYHGINIPILWAEAIEKGYPSHRWLTFKQAQENGATVRQGEKSVTPTCDFKYRLCHDVSFAAASQAALADN